MRCSLCGAQVTKTRENHLYNESGLPGITLLNVEVRHCAACGERSVVIPAVAQLHRAIAQAVVQKPSALTGDELRFLRKHLERSSKDFAEVVGARPETVTRWEKGDLPMPPQLDRLVRLMVVHNDRKTDYSIDALRTVGDHAEPTRFGFVRDRDNWALAA
jgi:putative zinc finger/helix-turn-helix YgiT family protein